jgi:flagellar hook-length control protein FliK
VRNEHPLANDIFGSLVSDSAAGSPAPPAERPRRANDNPPPANGASAAAHGAASQPANNNPNNHADAGPPPTADDGTNTNANAGAANNGATQPSAGSSESPSSGSKSADKQSGDDDSTADTTVAAQQAGVSATTPIPLAVAVTVTGQPTHVPATPPSSGGSTAPLAIAAAAIAASSQPLAGPGGTPATAKTDTAKTDTAKTDTAANPATTTKAAPASSAAVITPGTQQATPANAPAIATAALTNPVTAAPPVAAKPASGKPTASSAASDADAGTSDAIDPTTAAGTAQTGLQQATAAWKSEIANAAADATTGAPANSLSPAISAHEHSPAASATHAFADPTDPGAQTAASIPQPLNSPAPSAAPGALTVTAASNGAVPLNGVALEIAASVKSGKSRFEIRLDPADLGRIDVRIDIDRNGQVTSHLTVEKPETLSLLRQDAPQLQRALDDAGLKTGNGGLQFSLRDQSSSGQNTGDQAGRNAQRLIISEDDSIPAAVAGRTYGRMSGSGSGVDIRV